MFSIMNGEYIASILNQSMLKAASGPEERPAFFTCELDSPQCAIHALVWTGWRTPQSVIALQHGCTVLILQRLGWQPGRIDRHRESAGSMVEGFVRYDVRTKMGVKVTNDPNSQWCIHTAFLLRTFVHPHFWEGEIF
jgi:hypothetical protein